MKTVDKRVFLYEIDAEDRLVRVNEHWVQFAQENKAPYITNAYVIGRPIWDFITGREIKHIFRILFEKIRTTGLGVELPFRCDSPECRRFMEMKITPLNGGSLAFHTKIIKEEFRDPAPILDAMADRSNEFVTMCSWCKRIILPENGWAEVEEAVSRLDLFGQIKLPQLTHGICPDCSELFFKKSVDLDTQPSKNRKKT
ncbi:MAG: hypothetical protein HYS21_02230 [Deltaproteobacteria bacterium]|nr:hypothetical protein [Deltaproteobacteria bacterium]